MKFDKSVFLKHYGKAYLLRIKGAIWCAALDIFLLIVLIATQVQIPFALGIFLVGIVVVIAFPILPLFGSYYIKALKMSERQKQWVVDNKIHVLIVPEDGFTWGGMVTHTKEYVIHSIESVKVSNAYIIVQGDITLIDNYNECIDKSNISVCKIPRNFKNEERILKYGGIVDVR